MENHVGKEVFLSFKLGNELFAVTVKKVLEVLQQQQLTQVPDTPDFILGVINFRGEIVPVADTLRKFKLDAKGCMGKKFVIIILELQKGDETILIGATAGSVKDVIEVSSAEIKRVPSMGGGINPEYIGGMLEQNDRFIMILDVEKIFSNHEINQFTNIIQA